MIIKLAPVMFIILVLVGCQETSTDLGASSRLNTGSNRIPEEGFNFSKSDQDGDAELLSPLAISETKVGTSERIQVIPFELEEGDEIYLSAWTDQTSELLVYLPSQLPKQWRTKEFQKATELVKRGVGRVEMSITATETGTYALAISPQVSEARYLLTAACLGGPCKRAEEEFRQASAIEEAER